MISFKTMVNKTWVFIAATALIAGSSSVMAFSLNHNVPGNTTSDTIPITAPIQENTQIQSATAPSTPEYKVVDHSKNTSEQKDLIKQKLSLNKNMTPEQIEEKCNFFLAAMIPGDKDISAEQAAAYAAGILKKAYHVDFTDYTADASFSRSTLPNDDNWTVIFHAPGYDKNSDQKKSVRSYLATVDSVDGTMLNASFYTNDYREYINKDVNHPSWMEKAVNDITTMLPANVKITSSKVVFATPVGGVIVVSDLSDGSAFGVRLDGENKEAVAYIFFPNGYDGSLDYHPVTEDGVG